MKTKSIFFVLVYIFLIIDAQAQQKVRKDTIKIEKDTAEFARRINEIKEGYIIRGLIIDGDTLLHVYAPEVIIFPPRKFTSQSQYRRYTRLVHYVKKVYPYSMVIKYQLDAIEQQLDTIQNERERKKFIKEKEKVLRDAFEGQLVKLTVTQGRILLKLVDRQTGFTTYELLDNLKGSFSASFWQSVAKIFGSDLKKQYDADGEDAMIEEIIILIENGQL